ncbi:MAG: NAD(P)/FAD-dependent oxidoreductase [Gammaproteobacteria bacterium]|nr:NAD(P)/FAD-dependent oxidoreductase [Gammaproteobacteria bacterium]
MATVASSSFDLAVIGSGPGGYKTALTAAQLGARVVLVERHRTGGICLNEGCLPKKALLRFAYLISNVDALNGRGLIGRVQGDFDAALAHKDEVIATLHANVPTWLKRFGVQTVYGHARLRDAHHIEVQTGPNDDRGRVLLTAGRIILATGAAPRQHAACPRDGVRIIDSHDFMLSMHDLPRSLLCIGGGTIGAELSYLLHQFGTRITLVEQSARMLDRPCIPLRASELLQRKLRRLGVDVRTGVTVESSRPVSDGVEVLLSDGRRERYERVLVAIGRRPVTGGLGLEDAGVETDAQGFIVTNEYLETTAPGVYAVGDVKSGPMTANAALHDARIAAFNAVTGNRLRRNYHRVPAVIDSALQIAAVGLSEEQAEAAGFEPDVVHTSFSSSIKARAYHDYEGFMEIVYDVETGQMLGGCIVGSGADEQIHLLASACQSERGLWFLRDINYSHPSWSEELGNALDPYLSEFARSGREVFRPGIYALRD